MTADRDRDERIILLTVEWLNSCTDGVDDAWWRYGPATAIESILADADDPALRPHFPPPGAGRGHGRPAGTLSPGRRSGRLRSWLAARGERP